MFDQTSSPQFDRRFYGNYRGKVVDNRDPRKVGRVRVRVYGLYDGVDDESLPWALYSDPFMGGQGSLGGIFVPDIDSEVWVFFENGMHMQPVYFAGAPSAVAFPRQKITTDQPESRGNVEYPFNRVIASKAGHVIELDDTEGNSRVRISHKSGSQIIMYDNGDVYERVAGNKTTVVFGDYNEYVRGSKKMFSLDEMDIRGSEVHLNKSGTDFDISEAEQRSYANSHMLVELAGRNAVIDTPEETHYSSVMDSMGFPPEVSHSPENTASFGNGNANVDRVEPDVQTSYGPVDYNLPLGGDYKLRDLTVGTHFPHNLAAQGGLSTDDIITNMKYLVANVIQPIRRQFPGLRINSAFRRGQGTSQHNKGQAVDFQNHAWFGKEKNYNEVVEWITNNIDYDQFILEHGNSVWLHVSYDHKKAKQRRMNLTYYGGNYTGGLKNHYNRG